MKVLRILFVCWGMFFGLSTTSDAATVVFDFAATVTNVNTFYLSGSSGLMGVTGQGHIEYDLIPDVSGSASCCSIYNYNPCLSGCHRYSLDVVGLDLAA